MTSQRMEKWRDEVSTEDVSLVEWAIGSNVKLFGYEPAGRSLSLSVIMRGLVSGAADAIRRRTGELPGALYYILRSRQLVKEETAKERFRNRALTSSAQSER